ncbi:MAG: 3-oxoacyl-ACP reductase FabG [Arenicellales bacterium]|nr:3-oxoacyl-ACP reductase FabG [Arenicellales bacterium]
MKLNNDVCLVTGASRGIGRAIATALARAGGIVVGTATSTDGAQSISDYLADTESKGSGAVLDVTNTEAVNTLVSDITQAQGAPTILVNNAGITRDNLLLRMKEEDWDAVLDTDLKSIYRVTKSCLRGMTKARKGRIINITSVVAALGNAGQCNYAAAKAGIVGFTKSLAAEVAPRGITVNAVAPGFIDTDMTRALSDAQREQLLQRIPIGRLGSADDVSNAVLFLASEASEYITGETLHVNGGMYMSH